MKKKMSVEESVLLTSEQSIESRKFWLNKFEQLITKERQTLIAGSKLSASQGSKRYQFDPEVSAKLRMLCNNNDLSMYIYVVTSLSVLLSRYTGLPFVSILTEQLKDSINTYNSTLPIIAQLHPDRSFKQHLIDMRENILSVIKHQNYPIEKVCAELSLTSDDLFDVVCSCTSLHIVRSTGSTPLRITLDIHEQSIALEFHTSDQLPFTSSAFFGQLQQVLAASLADIELPVGKIELLSGFERHEILTMSGSAGSVTEAESTVAFRLMNTLRKQCAQGGVAVAAEYGEKQVSYATLNNLILRISDFLLGRWGLTKGDRVVVMIDRSEWMLIIPVALLQSGLVYVPIDNENPEDRVCSLLEDIRPAALITSAALGQTIAALATTIGCRHVGIADLAQALATCEDRPLPSAPEKEMPAYIIYTSGSTGHPKGVVITHGNLDHFFNHVYSTYLDGAPVNMPFVASNSFDISLFQLLTPLLSGGTSIVVDKNQLLDPDGLMSLLKKATVVDTVPALYGQIVQLILSVGNSSAFRHIRRVFIGGDLIPEGLLHELSKVFPAAAITVTYGPTEGTMFCTDLNYAPGTLAKTSKGTLIGRPISNGQILVLGLSGELLPVGIEGEICIGGAGVAHGYFNRSELTAEKFTDNPYAFGSHLYHTGDQGRWTTEGLLEFRGRKDDQVKIHGYRIELPEIESALRQHPSITDAAVAVSVLKSQERSLAGYYVKKRKIQVWPSISEYMGYNEVAYFAMNNDALRVGSYRKAIEQIAKGNVIIDVGTGPEAILAQYCIQAGASKVYAIELIEEVYYKAKHTVESLGLEDKIIVIHGNIMDVELPEKADYCICAIVGNMGSTDGCIPIMNSARKLLKDSSCMVPHRSVTKIAAVNLKDDMVNYAFTQTGGQYVKEIFEFTGGAFDLRIGLQNVREEDLVSTKDVFEDLDLSTYLPLEGGGNIDLTITADTEMTGFLVWLNLYTRPDIVYDIFPNQKSFLPIYWPVFDVPLTVRKGNRIKARTWREFPEGQICPDLGIEGQLIKENGDTIPFYYLSRKRSDTLASGRFYSKVFPGGELQAKPVLSSQALHDFLQSRLPRHMVPAVLVEVEKIPVTNNGKIDRQRLLELNILEDEATSQQYVAPANEVESGLALICQNLLKVPRVGVHDNFFRIGGDSITTIQMSNRARRAGYEIRVADIFANPTIAGLASFLAKQGRVVISEPGEQGMLSGISGLLPAQQWYLRKNVSNDPYFHQSVLFGITKQVDQNDLATAIGRLLDHHDALRYNYTQLAEDWQQEYGTVKGVLDVEDCRSCSPEDIPSLLPVIFARYQKSLNIEKGELIRFVLIKTPESDSFDRLLIVCHHLVMDGVSWRILLEDLNVLLSFLAMGADGDLGRKSTSCRQWHNALERYGKSKRLHAQMDYWSKVIENYNPLPVDITYKGVSTVQDTRILTTRLSQAQTTGLVQYVPRIYNTEINDLLLTALVRTLNQWSGQNGAVIGLEGHGREDVGERTDLSRTVGWLSTLYPVYLAAEPTEDVGTLLTTVKKQLRQVPDKGIGYGVLKEINKEPGFQDSSHWDFVFNFLGHMDSVTESNAWLSPVQESTGSGVNPNFVVEEKLSLNTLIEGGELQMTWRYSQKHYLQSTVIELARMYQSNLLDLIHHCMEYKKSEDIYASLEYGLKGNSQIDDMGASIQKKSGLRTIMDF